MTSEVVDRILKGYAENKARLAFLQAEIPMLRRVLASDLNMIVEDEVRLSGDTSGMPHGTTISDPTASLAVKLADGYVPPRIAELRREIANKEQECATIKHEIAVVNAWLDNIPPMERYVVESKVINGTVWRRIIIGFDERFGELYSKEGLKRILRSALTRIYRISA